MDHPSRHSQGDGNDRSASLMVVRTKTWMDRVPPPTVSRPGSRWLTPVGVRTSEIISGSNYATILRVPGSFGDPGCHRESLVGGKPKPVKFIEDVVPDALGEGISPPMLLMMEGCDG